MCEPKLVCMPVRFLFSERPGKDNSMTPEKTETAEKMKSVKAARDRAPDGPKKDAALKHYRAAEKALSTRNHFEANRELEAVALALA